MNATDELFDSSEYTVPFQDVDGHDVTDLALHLGGNLKLNRNDPAHAAMIEALTLGRRLALTAYAVVASKQQIIKHDLNGTEQVTYAITLRIESVEENGV